MPLIYSDEYKKQRRARLFDSVMEYVEDDEGRVEFTDDLNSILMELESEALTNLERYRQIRNKLGIYPVPTTNPPGPYD